MYGLEVHGGLSSTDTPGCCAGLQSSSVSSPSFDPFLSSWHDSQLCAVSSSLLTICFFSSFFRTLGKSCFITHSSLVAGEILGPGSLTPTLSCIISHMSQIAFEKNNQYAVSPALELEAVAEECQSQGQPEARDQREGTRNYRRTRNLRFDRRSGEGA